MYYSKDIEFFEYFGGCRDSVAGGGPGHLLTSFGSLASHRARACFLCGNQPIKPCAPSIIFEEVISPAKQPHKPSSKQSSPSHMLSDPQQFSQVIRDHTRCEGRLSLWCVCGASISTPSSHATEHAWRTQPHCNGPSQRHPAAIPSHGLPLICSIRQTPADTGMSIQDVKSGVPMMTT